MIVFKKLWLLLILFFFISSSYAQNINWMLGAWKGAGNAHKAQFIKTIDISSVSGESFTGTRSKEANDHNHSKIVTAITGHIGKDTFYIKDGDIVFKKDPPHGKWFDCTQCVPFNKVLISDDSILLSSTITDCQALCNGTTVYYKLLPDFDTATQRVIVDMFGTPDQILAFKPFGKTVPPVASSDPDAINQAEDSAKNAEALVKRKQQYEDSLKNAGIATRKREQQMLDSLKLAASITKKRQQEYDDSLQSVAKIKKQRQQQIDDSLQNVANIEKQKRQQEIDDSLKAAAGIAKQKQQQYNDSLKIAEKRQQQIDDSLQNVANIAKQKRQQEIDDSLQNVANIAKQKRQQEIADSLKNAAIVAKQKQQRYDDSVSTAKKRQQKIADSLKLVAIIEKQNQQQRTADSLKNAAIVAKQKQQRYDDSVSMAKKRQQQIDDSLQNVANIAKQKRQQEIADSLKNAAIVAKQKQQRYDDSVSMAKKRQQKIADSLKLVAIIEKQNQQQRTADSLKNAAIVAKQKQQHYDDSVNTAKKRQQKIADSLQNIAQRTKIRQQEIDDSIKIAAGKKQPVTDTAKTAVTKALMDKNKALVQRDNVLLQTYHIKNPDILIELFDNAEIDGDRVSVFHNNTLIVNNQTLLREPITFKVHADSANRTHEFVLIAENLGTIPPNTALMRVTADNQVYKLSVKTDLKTNAKIVFYYDGN